MADTTTIATISTAAASPASHFNENIGRSTQGFESERGRKVPVPARDPAPHLRAVFS
jgi:hypothetical protein